MAFSRPSFTAQIIGRLGGDPEMRYTAQGKAVTNLNVAVDRSYKGADGQRVERTVWVKCTAWGAAAEVLNRLTKGDRMLFTGNVGVDSWLDKNTSEARAQLTLEIDQFEYIQTKRVDNGSAPAPEVPAEEEIPF